MALLKDTGFGLSCRFDVWVDGIDLGGWATCAGLRVDFAMKEIKEGGTNSHLQYLPDRIKYERVTLTRAITRDDFLKLAGWLAGCVDRTDGGTARIILRDAQHHDAATWTLTNVRPWSYRGPEMAAGSANLALATLELVHDGFLQGS
jgi:phage tail-like protein